MEQIAADAVKSNSGMRKVEGDKVMSLGTSVLFPRKTRDSTLWLSSTWEGADRLSAL